RSLRRLLRDRVAARLLVREARHVVEQRLEAVHSIVHRSPSSTHAVSAPSRFAMARNFFSARARRRLIVASETPHAAATSSRGISSMNRSANGIRSSGGGSSSAAYTRLSASRGPTGESTSSFGRGYQNKSQR